MERPKVGPKGETRGIERVKQDEFSRIGRGFAGEFHWRYDSCLFEEFVVQMLIAFAAEQAGLIRFPSGLGCLKLL
jgi:hypothetical protein